MKTHKPSDQRHLFPSEIISHARMVKKLETHVLMGMTKVPYHSLSLILVRLYTRMAKQFI